MTWHLDIKILPVFNWTTQINVVAILQQKISCKDCGFKCHFRDCWEFSCYFLLISCLSFQTPLEVQSRWPLTEEEKKYTKHLFRETIHLNGTTTMKAVREAIKNDDKLKKLGSIEGRIKKMFFFSCYCDDFFSKTNTE